MSGLQTRFEPAISILLFITDATVMTIQADDKDAGNNGSVRFRLKENSIQPQNYPDPTNFYPYFEIDETGVVKTRAMFDRETVDSYTLEVVAYDLGTPTAKSSKF